MINKSFHLKELLSDSDFQKMQDEIATATNVAMITVDYSGTPITLHSSCNEFCKCMRQNNKYKYLCEKCDSRGGVEAARLKKPYIYLCHMGIVDFAIPIIVNDIYMGAIMAGQLLISDNDSRLECIVSERSYIKETDNSILIAYNKLPKMSLKKIIALSNMISYLCNSFIRENLNKNSTEIACDKDLENNSTYLNNKARQLIAPAIDYIDNNYKNNISLNYISELCQISSSYLSRLFKKAIGYNFAHYTNIVRILHAKKMLISTNNSIASMAIDLGYDDSGYFIKVFKRLEGITPNEYRNKYNKNNELLDELKISSILQS